MNIGHISTFSPTPCGIATYTEFLIENLPHHSHSKLRLAYHFDLSTPDTFLEIKIEERPGYSEAASIINKSAIDIVSLQHEFAIFGGKDGEYVIDLVRSITKPIVTTLHSTPKLMSTDQMRILQYLVDRSAAVVLLTERAKANVALVAENSPKMTVIRHGVPQTRFELPTRTPLRKQLSREHVFVSAGHVRDSKGYTNFIAALAELRKITEDFLYIIIGTYQPQFGTNSPCLYALKRMIGDLDLIDHVQFHDRYVEREALIDSILASDIGIVTYTDCQQCSSGMVPMILGCGRPVIATPFEYVLETATAMPGLYVCDGYQSRDIFEVLRDFVIHKDSVVAGMPEIYVATRTWLWSRAASEYAALFADAFARS